MDSVIAAIFPTYHNSILEVHMALITLSNISVGWVFGGGLPHHQAVFPGILSIVVIFVAPYLAIRIAF